MTASAATGDPGGAAAVGPNGSAVHRGPGTGHGFCRVTIVAPDSRIDVALPDDVPVADLQPEILRLARQAPEPGAPVGYHLVRRDGTVLDSARSFTAQRIPDGELLTLRPFADSLAPVVFDDVSEAVAAGVSRDRTLWSGELTRAAGLTGGGVLAALIAFLAWSADPGHDMNGIPGVLAAVTGLLLLTLGAVRARVYDDRAAALALGLGALPNVAVAGSGLLAPAAGQGIGQLHVLTACAAVLLAALFLTAASPRGDGPFVAFAFAAGIGLLATFTALLAGFDAVETAAVCVPVAVGALAFLPGLSMRFARLPVGFAAPSTTRGPGPTAPGAYGEEPAAPETVDAERVAAQARRGHELLVGLVGGCALVAVGAAAVLGFSDDPWARLLALATGLSLLLRAQLFRYSAQVGATLAAGLGSLVLLGLGLALNPPAHLVRDALRGDGTALDVRTVWLVAAFAVGAALVTSVGLIVSRGGVSPFWGRFLELAEGFFLLTLVPLALAVFDLYAQVRALVPK
ncbi:type VII secretion integral membrane protein EccD [Streptomyces sp. NPDC002454]|uniref:type VII secretion integral membrane protein EccD n=1 Tax=Streptomyces sp. NPDC002490 TaxID=3154416 RepID=UPI0033334A3E